MAHINKRDGNREMRERTMQLMGYIKEGQRDSAWTIMGDFLEEVTPELTFEPGWVGFCQFDINLDVSGKRISIKKTFQS